MTKLDELLSRLVISPTSNGTYKLLKPLVYRGIIVPYGEETNGGNIPRMFRGFILPFAPRLLLAFAIHDYFCNLEKYKKADRLFYKALKDLEVVRWKRRVLYRIVKTYHRIRYNV